MGLHTLPTPAQSGLGQKFETFVHGLGAFKTAYDVGGVVMGAARAIAPMAASVGRAALPLLSAVL